MDWVLDRCLPTTSKAGEYIEFVHFTNTTVYYIFFSRQKRERETICVGKLKIVHLYWIYGLKHHLVHLVGKFCCTIVYVVQCLQVITTLFVLAWYLFHVKILNEYLLFYIPDKIVAKPNDFKEDEISSYFSDILL